MEIVLDARSGRLVKEGETVYYPDDHDSHWTLVQVQYGVFNAYVKYVDARGSLRITHAPIHYFPKWEYKHAPSDCPWRIAVFPS